MTFLAGLGDKGKLRKGAEKTGSSGSVDSGASDDIGTETGGSAERGFERGVGLLAFEGLTIGVGCIESGERLDP
jgi:hypothetical protein